MRKKGHEGFTLMESLLVLLCVSVFFTVPLLMVKSWKEQTEVSLFFNQLERNIQRTHQSAIVEGQRCDIYQQRLANQFVFRYYHHGELKEDIQKVDYPVVLRSAETINFKAVNGNIQKIETIKLEDHLNKKVVRYQFQLGSGKVIRSEAKL